MALVVVSEWIGRGLSLSSHTKDERTAVPIHVESSLVVVAVVAKVK